MVYQEIKQLLPDITDVNLRQKILRARKLYKLFNTLGLEKIKQVSYSADAISSLNYQQIQNIIDYVNSVTSSHNETVKILHDQSHVTLKTVSQENDQIKAEISTLANILSASQSNSTCDRSYFRSKTLDQYPNLYREFSSENFDYYGITDDTSCPLCKLDHYNFASPQPWSSPCPICDGKHGNYGLHGSMAHGTLVPQKWESVPL